MKFRASDLLTFLGGEVEALAFRFLILVRFVVCGGGELYVGEVELGLRVFEFLILILFCFFVSLDSLLDGGSHGRVDCGVGGGAPQLVQRIT